MFDALRKSWREGRAAAQGMASFFALPPEARKVAFYAESAADWAHLGDIVSALRARGVSPALLTSSLEDPVLSDPAGNAFFIGSGASRQALFRSIDSPVFAMTLPDLETFYLKRSAKPVHYVYVFHSIASMHRVYREHAFDAYDTVLCVGPHHEKELRRAEELYGSKKKRLVPHGYARLDRLICELEGRTPPPPLPGGALRVLVAPTWGESSLLAYEPEKLFRSLLDAGHHVTLRLHPMTKRHEPALAGRLLETFASTGRFTVDPVTEATKALLDADIMVSDWSGSILEYAFARLRPALSIATPPKTHNPNWADFALPCLEEDIRGKIGVLLPVDTLERAGEAVRSLAADAPRYAESLRALREETVYNIGRSAEAAADEFLRILSGKA
jgi:YidC/Oxa1 family membrane protein insertase